MALLDYYKGRKKIPWKKIDGRQDAFPKNGVMDGNHIAVFRFSTNILKGFEIAYIDIVVDSVRIKNLFPGKTVLEVMSKCLEGMKVEAYRVGDWNFSVLLEFNPPLREDPDKLLKSIVRPFSKKFGELLEKGK
jgi:hypothetical protein